MAHAYQAALGPRLPSKVGMWLRGKCFQKSRAAPATRYRHMPYLRAPDPADAREERSM